MKQHLPDSFSSMMIFVRGYIAVMSLAAILHSVATTHSFDSKVMNKKDISLIKISSRKLHEQSRPSCSLNGFLESATVCACDAPWSGVDCSIMKFKPISLSSPKGYGMSPNLTTWGGRAFFDEKTKLYHLYVTAITNGCPLRRFGRNSRIDHAVSNRITGPYVFADVAINTESHNPAPIQMKDGTYAIFHIFGGSGSPTGHFNCTQDDNENQFGVSSNQVSIVERREKEKSVSSTIHVSNSIDGPWVPLQPNTLGKCINPAPFQHPTNGTIFIICNHNELKRSNSISGPWVSVVTIPYADSDGPRGNYEDPFLWIDHRGAFHVLYHVYNLAENGEDCTHSTVSAHGFSLDGLVWYFSPIQPYGTQIALEGNKTMIVSTRERPFLFFNKDGRMTHLFNGVSGVPKCLNSPCARCKFDYWDFTLVTPFDVPVDFLVQNKEDITLQ